ncbi:MULTISPECIES: nitrite/sulfite reductase [Thermomonospora]|uniref:assimilatory sulfite reductase (ferredoxin) n=1 Tax=Thermomonospora curvata (strain ATCC 19995 / DSM 43183 / JCM 3096 / KCTC 9072 / NBRC 15933 / NCIMB 10081 / Henssen B9) TaxID=471852 RepID=D1AC96_THECD|nr:MULTISPECIES: nitrite/sulfite reductase [Thermomonospora]ACY97362.1 nitrite and sulphite reductase 4Fe-4S region [Thermomonospora curvata DSM 43183]PKK14722.1 MAG: sulfite reductase [Thermomonospora sp. CIF 1]
MPPSVRRKRGEGQWALGYREPLNKNEETKKNDDGLNVRRRIIDIYSKTGFDSIDPADLRGRFRWYGLYTQRRPGIDGGKTGALPDEELDDRYFMLRIRIDGGQLDTRQLRVIADISNRYGRGTADVTDRQNIQLHWVEIENVPAIWEALEAVGLTTTEACGDTPRVIIGCPLAGIAADEVIDATPQIRDVRDRYIGSPEFSNLPRKFKSAISGCSSQCTVPEINDVAFVGVVNDAGEAGYQLLVGGGLSTNPMFAQSLGVFVRPEQVHEVWKGVTSVFRDYGYRRLRSRARLKFLVKDWGAEKFRQVLEQEYLGYALPDGPEPAAPLPHRDHVGIHRQKDGNYYVGFAPKVGRLNGDLLKVIADLADEYGSGRVRTTAEQKMVILDVPEARTEELAAELARHDLQVRPSVFRRQTMACTGIEYCKLAIVETKQRGMDLIEELEKRLPDFDQPLSININGCPNACARIQVADIGLKGQLVVDESGEQVEGFQIHLGGRVGASFGRKVRGLKTTADGLADYVERVVRKYDEQRAEGESFADWVHRADEADLQ